MKIIRTMKQVNNELFFIAMRHAASHRRLGKALGLNYDKTLVREFIEKAKNFRLSVGKVLP